MNAERYERLVAIFQHALELDGGERDGYLEQACAGDDDLLAEARSMLARDATRDSGLERAAAAAAELLGDDALDADVLPKQIGTYRILRRLGAGGMGVVYEAEQDNPRRKVALKLVHPGMALRRHLRRFEFESEVLGRLEHPGIARIFEAGTAQTEWGELPYFAMELVQGPTITRWCDERGLDARERIKLLADICDALEHAHGKGIVHRDIKPANVLVGADGQLKVLDFGVARLTDDGPTDKGQGRATALTREGQIVGTIAYSSPEQVRGDVGDVDARTDVYAIGVLGYELLTGRLPYDLDGRSLGESARIVETVEPRPLASLDPALRGDPATIFAKALAKDPERRYASASALAADLRRYLNHETIAARPTTAGYRLAKFARRNRLVVGSTVAVVLTLAGAVAVSSAALVRETHARETADAESERAKTEAVTATEVTDFLIGMFEVSQPGRSRGEFPSAEEILARGAEDIASSLADRPVVRARLLDSIGRVYLNLGFPANAEPLLEEALELRRSLGDDYQLEVAETLQRVAQLRQLAGRYDEGVRLQREALEIRLAVAPDDDGAVAEAQANLASKLAYRGDAEEAEGYLRQARERFERQGDPVQLAGGISQLGSVLQLLGRHEEALRLAREAVDLIREHDPGGRDEVSFLSRVGLIEMELGRYEQSVETLRATAELGRAIYDKGSLNRAAVEVNLADALVQSGRAEEALPILRAAHAEIEARYGADHPRTVQLYGSLASAMYDVDKVEALAMHEKALEQHERVLGVDHRATLAIVNNLAALCRKNGLYERAIELDRRVWQTRQRTLGPGHLLTLNSQRKVAAQMRDQERFDEAEALLVETRAACAESLGPDHAETASCALDLAKLYARTERVDDARALLREAESAIETESSRGQMIAGWLREELTKLE